MAIFNINHKGNNYNIDKESYYKFKKALIVEDPFNIIEYLLELAISDNTGGNKFARLQFVMINLFFAINPAYQYYEKINIIFDYVQCLRDDINIIPMNNKEKRIFNIIMNLRKYYT
jgi:hypothetical protein